MSTAADRHGPARTGTDKGNRIAETGYREAQAAGLRRRRLEELGRLKARGQKVIGYLCLYAPVELIAAAGAIPVRLMRSSAEAESSGERFLRYDACSFCKCILGGFEREPLFRLVDAVVSVTTCDMMRRLPEAIESFCGIPTSQVYLPRTSEPESYRLAEFRRQLALFGEWLGSFVGRQPDEDSLRQAIETYNRLRGVVRRVDEVRAKEPPTACGSDVLDAVALATLLDAETAAAELDRTPKETGYRRLDTGRSRPRLMLGGSIITEDDRWLVEMVEEKADVVADIVCTGARWAAEDVAFEGEALGSLARFYFGRVPCMCRRPNSRLYEYARGLVSARRVQGLVYKTLLYCDAWSFEARRLHEELGIPVLAIDSDYSGANREQVRTRIEAFLETL